jgi:predicted nucleotidyltransferase
MFLDDLTVDRKRPANVYGRYGVQRLEVFGSFGRAEAEPDSEIDLLVTFKPDVHLGLISACCRSIRTSRRRPTGSSTGSSRAA